MLQIFNLKKLLVYIFVSSRFSCDGGCQTGLALFSPGWAVSQVQSCCIQFSGQMFSFCSDAFHLLTPPQPLSLVISHSPQNQIDTSRGGKGGRERRKVSPPITVDTEMPGIHASFYSLPLGDPCTLLLQVVTHSINI